MLIFLANGGSLSKLELPVLYSEILAFVTTLTWTLEAGDLASDPALEAALD